MKSIKTILSAIDKVSQQPSVVTTAPSQPHRENSRKRNAGDDDVYDQKHALM